jgi:non-haem Fe2+, alpha-ketoglutarate-dependent halogenase
MTGIFTERSLVGYQRDGFAAPIDVVDPATAHSIRLAVEDAEQRTASHKAHAAAVHHRTNYVVPEVDALTRNTVILNAVESILGPDLLCFGCSLFTKEANTEHFVSWHQDLHYWGLNADDEVTAWVALSPATLVSGCMRFMPGSHLQIVEHVDTFSEQNLLSRGQEVAVEVDEAMAVDAPLQTGQVSLHHGRTSHASHPNRSSERRIGVAIRYITPRMAQTSGDKAFATLVRGTDAHGNFELFAGPRGTLADADLEVARRALEINHQNNYRGAAQKPGAAA